jgi:D-alanine-D-alanine ligase
MKIGFTYDSRAEYLAMGYSEEAAAEFDSEITINAIASAIEAMGHRVDRIGRLQSLVKRLASGDTWDLVFNIAEGVNGRGRESQVPCLLDAYNIPYTFSDPLVCATTLDKAVAKRLVQSAGINTARFQLIACEDDVGRVNLRFPMFAKPVWEGTGKGVDGRSKVSSVEELRIKALSLMEGFRQPVLVEEYLPGREFTTALLGTGACSKVLGSMEVRIRASAPARDYSYEIKENWREYVDYFDIDDPLLREEVESLALGAHRTLECRDASRVDIRIDRDGKASFIEINPLPGLNPPHSDLPMIARRCGMSYDRLIGEIVESACVRLRDPAPCCHRKDR